MSGNKSATGSLTHLAAAIITLFAFFTGISSLPAILRLFLGPSVVQIDRSPVGQGILSAFGGQAQVAISLVSLPAFCITNACFLVAVAFSFFAAMDRLGINAAISDVLFGALVLLPFAVGLNMLFMIVLFGTYLQWFPALFGLACFLVTWLLVGPGSAIGHAGSGRKKGTAR